MNDLMIFGEASDLFELEAELKKAAIECKRERKQIRAEAGAPQYFLEISKGVITAAVVVLNFYVRSKRKRTLITAMPGKIKIDLQNATKEELEMALNKASSITLDAELPESKS
jgi:hypothetical protein